MFEIKPRKGHMKMAKDSFINFINTKNLMNLTTFKWAIFRNQSDIGGLMVDKRLLMKNIIESIPSRWSNPFCQQHAYGDCKRCWYKKKYGACGAIGSARRNMLDAIDNLNSQIDLYWRVSYKVDNPIDEDILMLTINNIDTYISNGYSIIEEEIRALPVNDLDKYMIGRKKITHKIVNMLPMGINHCAFCLSNGQNGQSIDRKKCTFCVYGRIQGRCFEEESVYKRILNAKNKLDEAIAGTWKNE